MALFFAQTLFNAITEVVPCVYPPPAPPPGQMDGLTCNWPRPREWKIWALAFSLPGMLFSVLALLGKVRAKLALALTLLVLTVWGLIDGVLVQLHHDALALRTDEKIMFSIPIVLTALLFYLHFATRPGPTKSL